jgi:hypothetical protein
VDFVLPAYKLGIELKHTRDGLKDAALGEQLMADRDRYAGHPNVSHLLCLVFDPQGLLRNPRALEDDLRRQATSADITVTVKIFDR